jgi:hypothetical protein
MIYALVFLLFAAYLAAVAASIGGSAWALLWPAASFAVFASAYALHRPRLLGKRPDGRLAGWAYLSLGPVFAVLAGVWHLQRRLRREAACHEIVPGLWLGRRPLRGEIPPGVRLVVDLTAEFAAARGVIGEREYVCLPTLDGLAPSRAEVEAVLARIEASGPVYVHCALGHGRSALVAAAVLLRRGVVGSIPEAERWIRARRPGVRLKGVQRRLLAQMFGG